MTRRMDVLYSKPSGRLSYFLQTDPKVFDMARILPDTELKKLIGTVIKNGDEQCVHVNSYEMRVGEEVRFVATGEKKQLSEGKVLEIAPSETAMICSYEELDFTRVTVNEVFGEGRQLVGLITPRTTMFREGIALITSKVDPGYAGTLNWPVRNDSGKPCKLLYKEHVYKLTLFLLEEDENPSSVYGDDEERDTFHKKIGIVKGSRIIPADIDEGDIVRSSFTKIDKKKRLEIAGPPFSEIGSELVSLDGKIVALSEEVKSIVKILEARIGTLEDDLRKWMHSELRELKSDIKQYGIYIFGAATLLFSLLPTLLKGDQTATVVSYVLAGIAGVLVVGFCVKAFRSKPGSQD